MPTDPNNAGQGSGDNVGYRVQVRCANVCHSRPIQLRDGIVSTEWRDVHFEVGYNPAGIPAPPFSSLPQHDLMEYLTAVAMAWTVIAQNQYAIGLECRLVAYRLETTWKLTREGSLNEDISSYQSRNLRYNPIT